VRLYLRAPLGRGWNATIGSKKERMKAEETEKETRRERERERKEQPGANRFKLPSTSHSRFQLETCLFPFWTLLVDFRALYWWLVRHQNAAQEAKA